MKEILALALESRGAVGHHTLALCRSNLAAEVGLAGLAELTLLAFGGAVRRVTLVFAGLYRAIRVSY